VSISFNIVTNLMEYDLFLKKKNERMTLVNLSLQSAGGKTPLSWWLQTARELSKFSSLFRVAWASYHLQSQSLYMIFWTFFLNVIIRQLFVMVRNRFEFSYHLNLVQSSPVKKETTSFWADFRNQNPSFIQEPWLLSFSYPSYQGLPFIRTCYQKWNKFSNLNDFFFH